MYVIAQFGAEKKSRNAANNECASHTIFRIVDWNCKPVAGEECENAGEFWVWIPRILANAVIAS